MAKKHSLTVKADKITGVSGKDLFLGAAAPGEGGATLTSDDKLNGGGGLDTLRADLVGGSVAAFLKNIEIGNFTNSAAVAASVDLSRAKEMTKLIVTDPAKTIDFTQASAVSSIMLSAVNLEPITVNGVDAKVTKTLSVTFDNDKDATLYLVTAGLKQLKNLDVTLENSSGSLGGNVDARTVTLHSTGSASNDLLLAPTGNGHAVEHLVIMGATDLDIDQASAFQDLKSFDASKATADLTAMIGGDHLASVLGSAGNDSLTLTKIAGSLSGQTKVSLGKGDDTLSFDFAFDASKQSYDGGKGSDQLFLSGAASALSSAVSNFELIAVTNAAGEYDVAGLKLTSFFVESTASATSVTHLANDASLVVTHNIANFLSVSLATQPVGEASLQLSIYNGSQLGTAVAGFSLTGVDELEIHTYLGDASVFFAGIGTSERMVELTMTASDDVMLSTSNGANCFISGVTVEGSGALDMSGFSSSGLNSAGVTVTGGAGDDVLIGGAGVDLVVTGGGDNTVLGSTGADRVRLTLGSGSDTLIFTEQAESGFGIPGDTVENFGAFDTIDISDIVSGVTFVGNVSDTTSGKAALLTGHASAYYNTTDHVLFIDINHNKELNGGVDMQLTLEGLATFSANQLIS